MAEQNLHSTAFPTLNRIQLESLGGCPLTVRKPFKKEEALFRAGEFDSKFFVIISGEVEIIDNSGDSPKCIVTHGPGQFAGDVSQLSGNPAVVDGIAKGDCEVYEVSPGALKQLINHHPDLGDIILQAFIARRQLLQESEEFTGLRVIGRRHSQSTFHARDFLAKNRVPFTWFDLDADPQVMKLIERFGLSEADTPVIARGDKILLRNPTVRQLAEMLGFCRPLPTGVFDLVIVGAGPASLAAAVYGASEGLRTVVVERTAPGGQAGRSMRIENYLGFPVGITGSELADRATLQANKFGVTLPIGRMGTTLTFEKGHAVLHLDDNERVITKCLLIATGADYRVIGAENCEKFEGCGIYYAATPLEAQLCRGSDVLVAGGGNSAGQAAVFLSAHVRKICLVIRGNDLNKDMSSYLVQRIESTPNIEVHRDTEIRRFLGDGFLSEVEVVNRKTGKVRVLKTPALFSFIGAVPRTDWLPPEIEKDAKGFVATGQAVSKSPQWTAERDPYMLETSRPGIFAIGDVRSGSVKRVASAVGEGAMAVQFVHQYLASQV